MMIASHFFVGRRFYPVCFGRIDNLNLQGLQLGIDFIQQLGGDGILREHFVNIAVGKMSLILGHPDQFLDFLGHLGRCGRGHGRNRRLSPFGCGRNRARFAGLGFGHN